MIEKNAVVEKLYYTHEILMDSLLTADISTKQKLYLLSNKISNIINEPHLYFDIKD